MQDDGSLPRGGVVVASGYGLKIYVEHGHLVVHDGIADDRRTRRFARVSSGLERLVVLGQAGYVTLEALAWTRDAGSAFVQLDSDGRLVSSTAAVGTTSRLYGGLRRWRQTRMSAWRLLESCCTTRSPAKPMSSLS